MIRYVRCPMEGCGKIVPVIREERTVGEDVLVSGQAHDCSVLAPWLSFSRWVRADSCMHEGIAYIDHLPASTYIGLPFSPQGEKDIRHAEDGERCVVCGWVARTERVDEYTVTKWSREIDDEPTLVSRETS